MLVNCPWYVVWFVTHSTPAPLVASLHVNEGIHDPEVSYCTLYSCQTTTNCDEVRMKLTSWWGRPIRSRSIYCSAK